MVTDKINPVVIDISHYQDVRDWSKVVDWGIWGVINKATEGRTLTDKTFALRREHAERHGLLYGAYHFLRPSSTIEAQAEHFLRQVGETKGLLLALDHEDRRVPLADAKRWLEIVERESGQAPVLYSGFLIKEQLAGKPKDLSLARHRLWLAHYSARPTWPATWTKPWLHQYTGDGVGPAPHKVEGIKSSGGIDINSYEGSRQQLSDEWAQRGETPVAVCK